MTSDIGKHKVVANNPHRHKMYICYFDESGDAGVASATLHPPTNWFVLACVLMQDRDWLDILNELVALRKKL